MEKLSRTARYKELRENLGNESPENFSRAPQTASTPVTQGNLQGSQEVLIEDSESSDGQSFVFKELEKEVRAYNQKKSTAAPSDDTTQNEAKRQSHLEPMDLNGPAGDVTTNISTIDVNNLASSQSKPAYSRMDIRADEVVEEDNLEVFDLGVDDFDRTIQQKKNPSSSSSKRKNKKAAKPEKTRKAAPAEEEEESEGGFSWLTLLLGLAIVVLLGSIAFMVYLIIQSGIL